jgi:aspartate-semialdehyde dehydrogenase
MIDKKDKYNVSVVGATGAVGRRMLAALEERNYIYLFYQSFK